MSEQVFPNSPFFPNSPVFPNSMAAIAADAASGAAHVSIIMRTRDRPVLLARALSSVLAQTHHNWHLFLVNDGGARDPVDRLVQEYATALQGRITLLHRATSHGMEAASNAALQASSGDFVCVHDDDDSWHPDYLASLSGFLNQPRNRCFAGAVCHCSLIWERVEDDGIVEEPGEPDRLSPERIDYASLLRDNPVAPISLMIRRPVVDAIGGFNEAMDVLGDWDYNLRILTVGDIGVVPRLLASYHLRRDDDPGPYGNSIVSHRGRHEMVRGLYRNSMLRRLAQEQPSALALVQALSSEAEANSRALREDVGQSRAALLSRSWDTESWDTARHADLRDRLQRVEAELAEMRATLAAIRQVTDALAFMLERLRAFRRRLRRRPRKAP